MEWGHARGPSIQADADWKWAGEATTIRVPTLTPARGFMSCGSPGYIMCLECGVGRLAHL